MVGSMVYQLTKGVPAKELERLGLGAYYSDHDHAVYPVSASGVPFTAAYIQSKGDPIADLQEDLAAEANARATYENLLNLADDPDVIDPLRFLRAREIVRFQRFGEFLNTIQFRLGEQSSPLLLFIPYCISRSLATPYFNYNFNHLSSWKIVITLWHI